MIIAFETKKLRTICEDDMVATKELGQAVADALKERLADVRAAESIADLIVGTPQTSGTDESTLTITLTLSAKTVWTPNHVSQPCRDDGRINWDRINRVRLLSIERS